MKKPNTVKMLYEQETPEKLWKYSEKFNNLPDWSLWQGDSGLAFDTPVIVHLIIFIIIIITHTHTGKSTLTMMNYGYQ